MPDEVHSGGDYPQGPGVEARLTLLETAVAEIRIELKAIRGELAALRVDVAEMKGRLTNIPTTFQLIYMQTAFVLAIFAAAFTLLRFGAPH